MIEIIIFVICWLLLGFLGFIGGTIIDVEFYKGNKPEWKMLPLCLALGPIVWIVVAKVCFDTWWNRRKNKEKE